jgi:hypothetical protein
MNWEVAQAVGELVAAFGVLASLIYLSAQVRQSSQRILGESIQTYTSQINGLRKSLWESEDGARLWQVAVSGLPPDDDVLRTRVGLFWISLYRSAEGAYLQYQLGHIPESLWAGYWTEWFGSFDTPGGRIYFAAVRDRLLDPKFVSFVDAKFNESGGSFVLEFRERVEAARQAELGLSGTSD